MNNQSIRANWKLIEDYPSKDGPYLVAFENSYGEFDLGDCEVWTFQSGVWSPLSGETSPSLAYAQPMFYIDVPMPRLD